MKTAGGLAGTANLLLRMSHSRHSLDDTTPPQPEDARGFALKCPKDGETMAKVFTHGITLDRCTGCGAMWFDAKELTALQRNDKAADNVDIGATKRTDARIKSKNLRCPRDNELMVEIEFPTQSHIHIMECKTCGGHLLDSGEFKDVASFTLGEKLKNFFS